MPENGPITGVDLENVTMTNSPSSINISFDGMPHNEAERRVWMTRQIAALRNALLGDDEYGVSGLVDTVRRLQIWLIIISVVLALLVMLQIWQQFQIQQILREVANLTVRIP